MYYQILSQLEYVVVVLLGHQYMGCVKIMRW